MKFTLENIGSEPTGAKEVTPHFLGCTPKAALSLAGPAPPHPPGGTSGIGVAMSKSLDQTRVGFWPGILGLTLKKLCGMFLWWLPKHTVRGQTPPKQNSQLQIKVFLYLHTDCCPKAHLRHHPGARGANSYFLQYHKHRVAVMFMQQ